MPLGGWGVPRRWCGAPAAGRWVRTDALVLSAPKVFETGPQIALRRNEGGAPRRWGSVGLGLV
jgi:hypothetical protein